MTLHSLSLDYNYEYGINFFLFANALYVHADKSGQNYIGKNRYICFMGTKVDIDKLEKISRALGDPYRVKMLDAIRNEPGGVTCNAMVELFSLAQSTVSHHLKQLVDAGLLRYEKEGRFSRYWINKKTFADFVSQLQKF